MSENNFDGRPTSGRSVAPQETVKIDIESILDKNGGALDPIARDLLITQLCREGDMKYSEAESRVDAAIANRKMQAVASMSRSVEHAPAPIPQPEPAPVVETPPPAPEPKPVPQPAPEVAPTQAPVAPQKPAPQSSEAIAPAQPKVNLGTKEHRKEFNPLDADTLDAAYLGFGKLISMMQSFNEIGSDLKQFFSSIPSDPSDPSVKLARSEAEQARYLMLKAAGSNMSPFMRNGKQAMSQSIETGDTPWEQYVTLPDGSNAGAVVPRDNDDGAALRAYRKRARRGIPNAVWLPATGIYISCRAPDEGDVCDFDIRLAMETSELGMSTYGMMLSSVSGVYLRHMIDFALSFVESTTLDCNGNDLKSTLIDRIDSSDYWLVLLAPIQAMWPDGIPWSICCGHLNCQEIEELRLNIARAIRYASGRLTDQQKALWARQRGNPNRLVTQEELEAYSKEHPDVKESVFVDGPVRFEFQRVSMGDYFDATDAWVDDINTSVTSALSGMGNQQDREKHLRLTAETRRLTQYAHSVKSITIQGDTDEAPVVETNPTEILKLLRTMSADRELVAKFEAAISDYSEATRLAIFGYMSRPCPRCSHDAGAKDGAFRGIVTISPDRVFFELSRAVSETQKAISKQSDVIG